MRPNHRLLAMRWLLLLPLLAMACNLTAAPPAPPLTPAGQRPTQFDGPLAAIARQVTPLAVTPPPAATASPQPSRVPKPTWTPTPFVEPAGCQRPPDDYTRVQLGNATLNARTLAMLDHAQALYTAAGGTLDLRLAITQGSYNAGGVAASFGTHDQGGAVDLSVRSRVDWSVQREEIGPLIHALRTAGFAAWLRDTGDLYPESPIHIHAIAIGDAEASEAARAQVDGTFGYLRGFDGLPRPDGLPQPDRHGGPVICGWMLAMGLRDMRGDMRGEPLPTWGG